MNKKRALVVLAAGLVVAGISGISARAVAGYVETSPVTLYRNAQGVIIGAAGSMTAARNSPDGNQTIGCGQTIYADANGVVEDSGDLMVSCSAADSNGTYASCGTSDPVMIATIRSLNSESCLAFWYNSSHVCTEMVVGVGSWCR
jgi:hypothetical protein